MSAIERRPAGSSLAMGQERMFEVLGLPIGRRNYSRALIISCGKKKAESRRPAGEMYLSPRFRASLALSKDLGARAFVASAKHGLLHLDQSIDPYDLSLDKLSPSEKDIWAASVVDSLKSTLHEDEIPVFLTDRAYSEPIAKIDRVFPAYFPLQELNKRDALYWIKMARRASLRAKHISLLYGEIERSSSAFVLRDMSKHHIPQKGVYIFVDDLEPSRFGGSGRIVRIGTHGVSSGSRSTLRNRLRNHLGTSDGRGSHRGSVFRLQVGRALLRRAGREADFPTWGIGQHADERTRNAEREIEAEVSQYIGDLRVVVMEADDYSSKKSIRAYFESNIIALLTEGSIYPDPPSAHWLGNLSSSATMSASGLWNVRDVGRAYDPASLGAILQALNPGERLL